MEYTWKPQCVWGFDKIHAISVKLLHDYNTCLSRIEKKNLFEESKDSSWLKMIHENIETVIFSAVLGSITDKYLKHKLHLHILIRAEK